MIYRSSLENCTSLTPLCEWIWGCRTYNGFDINGFGQLKDGRGNIAPVTIILPTLAMEANRDVEVFIKQVKNTRDFSHEMN